MKEKITNIMSKDKRKMTAVALCGTLVLTLGTSATFAASTADKVGSIKVKNENSVMSYSTDGGETWNTGTPEGIKITDKVGQFINMGAISAEGQGNKVAVKIENGERYYSVDGGKTWSENAPEGFSFINNVDGNVKFKNKGIFSGDDKGSVRVKNENGVISYSTDGGETWSENAPEGFEVLKNGGSIKVKGK